jgi:peptide/nickel transport system substrate-binding protein
MWTAVGVKTDYKQQERTFARERFQTNERDAQCFTLDSVAEFALRGNPGNLQPAWLRDEIGFAPLYREYYDTNGASGDKPPQEIEDLRSLVNVWKSLSPDDPRYHELGVQWMTAHTRNLWYIGLTVAPRVVMLSNKLGNTPKEGTFANDYRFWYPFRGEAWFFK